MKFCIWLILAVLIVVVTLIIRGALNMASEIDDEMEIPTGPPKLPRDK